MNEIEKFNNERIERIKSNSKHKDLQKLSKEWIELSMKEKYVYNFTWMGVPIIQYPGDIVMMQELIWKIKPDLIIETGIAHGGSIILSASMLELIGDEGLVVGIDIDIRDHNREAIERHPMSKRIKMIQGSSIDHSTIEQVKLIAKDKKKVLIFLDSNHTADHVLSELKQYSPLVSKNSYVVVFDTFVEDMPEGFFKDRPWDVGNNPKNAVFEFLQNNPDFVIDDSLFNKVLISVAPSGFLKRIS